MARLKRFSRGKSRKGVCLDGDNPDHFRQAMADMSSLVKIFVYGTLKRGEPNHHWMAKPEDGVAYFLGEGKTAVKYPLVIASKYNIPYLLDVPGTGNNIEGDVFDIDDKMLKTLDIIEQYPTHYFRRQEKIILADDKENQCWTYFLTDHKPSLLELPMLESYSSSGDHGLPYVEKNKRDPLYDFKVEVIQNYQKEK